MTRRYGWRETPANHEARLSHRGHRLGAMLFDAPSPPNAVDIRRLVVGILDQGQTETCGPHAVAQGIRMRADAEMPTREPIVLPSRRALYRMSVGFAHASRGEPIEDNGTTFGDIFSGAWVSGVVSETEWPWDESAPLEDIPLAVQRVGADQRWTLDGYTPIGDGDRVRDIKAALARAVPVVLGVRVDAAFEAPDGPIVVRSLGEDIGGHAMVCCGYTSEGLWVANSWGGGWRAGGFALLSWALVEGPRVLDPWAITVAPPVGAVRAS